MKSYPRNIICSFLLFFLLLGFGGSGRGTTQPIKVSPRVVSSHTSTTPVLNSESCLA